MHSHQFRLAADSDAHELARLMTVLGHPTTADSIGACWESWVGEGNTAIVAALPERLLGVVTLHRMTVLHRPKPVGRITALVVDPACRAQGIGRQLVARAEQALAQAGCGLLEITSNVSLVDAHRFYEGLGYQRTSIRLAKDLAAQ